MNILMILDGEFPPDERVEKEAVSLIGAGNNVSILCLNYGNYADSETYKGISVKRLKINKTFRNKIMATYLVVPFYRMFWKKAIKEFLANNKVDVIHIHDLPLSDLAISLRKKHKFRVVCDQHEFYSNWIVRTAHYNTFTGKIVKALSRWDVYEKKNLSAADLVITVEEPLKSLYVSKVGIEGNKIVVLPNTPNASVFNTSNTDALITEKYRNSFVIFYAGTIDILRGLNTVIEALPILREHIPNLKFLFAGRFRGKYYNPVEYIEKIGVSDMADFLGWVPLEKLPCYISASHICLHVPPATSMEVNNSIATKIYQYVLMNKPIIVGQARMMKEFVEGNRVGVAINESDPGDLAEKIRLLHSNPSLREEFSANAALIAGRYSWEETSKPFLESYKNLSK